MAPPGVSSTGVVNGLQNDGIADLKMEAPRHVRLDAGKLRVTDLEIVDDRVEAFFSSIPEAEWDDAAARALTVGVLCLERANTQADVDYLKKEVQSMVGHMRDAVKGFGDGIIEKVGTDKGQVLEPVKQSIETTQKQLDEKLKEVQTFLADDIDPDRQTSVLARAMKSIKDLMDPERSDSIQGKLQTAVEEATGEKGRLAVTVKEVVGVAIEPLAKELKELGKEIRGQEEAEKAREEVVQRTTEKGDPFEIGIVEELTEWAKATGAQVEHCGPDNQPGDVIVRFPSISASGHEDSIVIEAKDRTTQVGRKQISDLLDGCMDYRNVGGAVLIKKDVLQYAKEIGDYAEGQGQRGPWIAATRDGLITAIRHLRVMMRIATIQATQPDVDVTGAQGGLDRIRASLKKVRTITSKAGIIRTNANEVEEMAKEIKNDIDHAIMDIENSLRVEPAEADPSLEEGPA